MSNPDRFQNQCWRAARLSAKTITNHDRDPGAAACHCLRRFRSAFVFLVGTTVVAKSGPKPRSMSSAVTRTLSVRSLAPHMIQGRRHVRLRSTGDRQKSWLRCPSQDMTGLPPTRITARSASRIPGSTTFSQSARSSSGVSARR